jgi:uncharacterized membrane protein
MIFSANTGCFLFLLFIINLFFGWLFLKPGHWLLVQGVLILILWLSAKSIRMNLNRENKATKDKNNVIDVEGKVVKDEGNDQ